MTIAFEILGDRARDNALLVRLDSGQTQYKLLFDCGDGCLSGLGLSTIQSIDALFFSHLHMDHIGGFDTYFRCNFDRVAKPNRIWGPRDTSRILQHRFQGFLWNLVAEKTGSWCVSDITAEAISTARFELHETFAISHDAGAVPFTGCVFAPPEFTVDAFVMDHGTDSIAYLVKEAPRRNIDMAQLAQLGLAPGPWMQELKSSHPTDAVVDVAGKPMPLTALRDRLLVETDGDSIAYLTDFYLDADQITQIAPALRGCQTLVCEAQYSHADLALAKKNRHMTVTNVAKLARAAGVGRLVLFHISERYDRAAQQQMLAQAQAIFPNTAYPAHWS